MAHPCSQKGAAKLRGLPDAWVRCCAHTKQQRESDVGQRNYSKSSFTTIEVSSVAVRAAAIRNRNELRTGNIRFLVRVQFPDTARRTVHQTHDHLIGRPQMKQEEEATRSAANRRSFLKGAGMTGIGVAGAAMIGGKLLADPQTVEASTAVSDLDILNFALNLEYLEAEFYSVSTYGATLQKRGILT